MAAVETVEEEEEEEAVVGGDGTITFRCVSKTETGRFVQDDLV